MNLVDFCLGIVVGSRHYQQVSMRADDGLGSFCATGKKRISYARENDSDGLSGCPLQASGCLAGMKAKLTNRLIHPF